MITKFTWKLGLGLMATLLPLAGGCRQESASNNTPTVIGSAPIVTGDSVPIIASPVADTTPAPASANAAAGDTNLPPETVAEELANAPAKPVNVDKPAPAGVALSPAVEEVTRLVDANVDESVLLSYVTNSAARFELTADQIIYLNDLGIPGSVVTAMISRDQQLKAAGVAASAAAPVWSNAPSPAPYAPPPADVAPQAVQAEGQPPAPQGVAAQPVPAAPTTVVDNSVFYSSLSPYGTWMEIEGYGRVWQPTVVVVNPSWQPYFDSGHWVYTDHGWYWMSDYSWGWAPFHYGRWFRHNRFGWCWAPDTVWGPSWVSWRYTDDYCGWAPLPPWACYRPGIGFTYFGHSVGWNFSFGIGFDYYAFVPLGHFHDHHIHHWRVPHDRARHIYERATPVHRIDGNHNRIVNHGVPVERVAAASHQTIKPVTIREARSVDPRSGRPERIAGRSLEVYRPAVKQVAASPVTTLAQPTAAATVRNAAATRPTRESPFSSTTTANGNTRTTASPATTTPSSGKVAESTRPTRTSPTREATRPISGASLAESRVATRPSVMRPSAGSTTPTSRTERSASSGDRIAPLSPSTSTAATPPTRSETRPTPSVPSRSTTSTRPAAPAPDTRSSGRTSPFSSSSRATPQPPPATAQPAPSQPTRPTPTAPARPERPATSSSRPDTTRSASSYSPPTYSAPTRSTPIPPAPTASSPVPSRSESARSSRPFSTPSYSAPASRPQPTYTPPAPTYSAPARSVEVPRSAPAPTYTPRPTYSAPVTPRAPVVESRPSISVPQRAEPRFESRPSFSAPQRSESRVESRPVPQPPAPSRSSDDGNSRSHRR